MAMPSAAKKTEHVGVYRLDEGRWLLKATKRDPKTNKRVAREKVIEAVDISEAVKARDALFDQLVELLEEEPVTPQRRPTTVADYAELWIERKAVRLRPGVVDHYLDVLGKWILPVLGPKAVNSITRADIEAWVAWVERQKSRREQAYSRDTLAGWWRVLCNFIRDAAADFDIPDPTRRIRPPTSQVRNVSEHRSLSAEQLGKLLSTVEKLFPRWYVEVYLIAFTGMRPSELYGLKWEDIDFEAGVATIARSVDARREVENPPKTGTPREVALTAEMKALLEAHRKQLEVDVHPGLESGLVFPSATGGYRGSAALLNLLRLARRSAGIPVTVGPKTMRKTFITLAALAGHDRLAIRANVGHCDEEMTERYAWVSNEEKLRVTNALHLLTFGKGRTEASKGTLTEPVTDGK